MRLERLEAGAGQPALGVIFGAVLLAAAGVAAAWLRLGLPLLACPLRESTGLPCPACGSTRLAAALLSGDVGAALGYNPLVFTAAVGVASWSVVSAAREALGFPAVRIVLSRAERRALRIGAAAALVAGWAYVVWRGV